MPQEIISKPACSDACQTKKAYIWAAVVLGVGLVASAGIGAFTFYKVRTTDGVLSVTGSTKQHVTSDQVKWVSSVSRIVTADALQGGYSQMAKDLSEVRAFLKQNGVVESQVTVNPVFMNEIYKQYDNGPKEYNLRQTIVVQSPEVEKIGMLAKNTQPLIEKGMIFSTDSLEYYYSKIADLRVSLLGAAVQDAKARATELVKASGRTIGALKDASSGVVQVLTPNSTDVSDYGSYDTSSVEKDVMVTVHASFTVR